MSKSILETGELTAADVERLLSQRLVTPRWPGASIASMRVDRQRFTPGKECTVTVSMELAGGNAPSGRQQAIVTYVPRKTLGRISRRTRQRDSGSGGALVVDEEQGLLIELFPGDWRLPSLPAALDPAAMAILLTPFMARGAYAKLDVSLLRYRPHSRALLNVVFRDTAGAPIIDGIGKVFATAGGAGRTWQALTTLAEQSGEVPVAPLPLFYDADWRFVLMEKVAGKPLLPLLTHGPADEVRDALSKAASAMHRFHAMTVTFEQDEDDEEEEPETRLLADELIEVRDQAEKFAGIAGWLSDAAYALCDGVEKFHDALAAVQPGLVHGSMKAEQIIVGDDHAVIVDLDGIGQGDPAVDIGNFTAKQFKDARNPAWQHLDGHGQAFLHEYVALSDDQPGMLLRCRLHEAVALARLAFRELHTARRDLAKEGPASPSGRLMEQAQRRLQEAGQA